MFSNVVTLQVWPRQEVVLCQTFAMLPLHQEWYNIHVLCSRTGALLSTWTGTPNCTALCVSPEERYMYSLGYMNSLEVVHHPVTHARKFVRQLQNLDRSRSVFMDCTNTVLVVSDGWSIMVLQRGSYDSLAFYKTDSYYIYTDFAFVDDRHVLSRRASEGACVVRHINDFTAERRRSPGRACPDVRTALVCVDRRGHGLLENCDGNFFRRHDFDGKRWETRRSLLAVGASHRLFRLARACSYVGDLMAVITEHGHFLIIPTHELRGAWMALCVVMTGTRKSKHVY